MTHPSILKSLPNPFLNSSLKRTFKAEVLLFDEASRGSVLEFLLRNGGMSEGLTRYVVGHVVDALLYAETMQERHPYIYLSNVLLKQDATPLLCGWSGFITNKNNP